MPIKLREAMPKMSFHHVNRKAELAVNYRQKHCFRLSGMAVEYSLFPDRPIPACYYDCRTALLWVSLHSFENDPEHWMNTLADLTRIFIAGNSSGGNITHYLAAKVGAVGPPGQTRVGGAILVHPFFGGHRGWRDADVHVPNE
ncbi:hypothetical protein MLD38_013794 [Melastoma candidum]|uniref:Uncharacterized protein n=1 Tax=Melastoma candidum TaxID=119954 RepID=A0ACB9RA45_9MYRT|nr:hypothetical protein MLD38_013794 [Melastoma candidum]